MIAIDSIAVVAESLPQPVDLAALFGNDHSVELEIGCGKGGFLLRQAKAHPERNYVGIEWANKFYQYASDRMARWGMVNVRIMRTDAKHFVVHRLPPACLEALHVYHPDPWPKKRHHKRRLFMPDFVEAAIRVLKPGGRLAVQTDHAEYFDQIQSVLSGRPQLVQTPFDDAEFGAAGERTETNYEVKYLREGRKIFRLAFRRTPS